MPKHMPDYPCEEAPVPGDRHVRLFKNGRNQALRIPREFELPGNEAILRKEGNRLIIDHEQRDVLAPGGRLTRGEATSAVRRGGLRAQRIPGRHTQESPRGNGARLREKRAGRPGPNRTIGWTP